MKNNMSLLNIPNLLTSSRVILSYFFVVDVLDDNVNRAIMILIIAMISDADGYVAKVLNQKTKFGELFDPFADSIFTLCAFFAVWYKGYMLLSWVLLLIFGSLLRGLGNVLMMKKYESILVTSSIWSKALGLFTWLVLMISLARFKYIDYIVWFAIIWTFVIGVKWLYKGIMVWMKNEHKTERDNSIH